MTTKKTLRESLEVLDNQLYDQSKKLSINQSRQGEFYNKQHERPENEVEDIVIFYEILQNRKNILHSASECKALFEALSKKKSEQQNLYKATFQHFYNSLENCVNRKHNTLETFSNEVTSFLRDIHHVFQDIFPLYFPYNIFLQYLDEQIFSHIISLTQLETQSPHKNISVTQSFLDANPIHSQINAITETSVENIIEHIYMRLVVELQN